MFVHNVAPFCKILHIPTAQIGIFTAMENPREASEDTNCLLFAIYFAAITSIASTDVANLFGWDKMNALSTFKHGLELSLARTRFLDKPTITSLEAMCIFLVRPQFNGPEEEMNHFDQP